jgi:hypothetical protein
MKIASYSGIPGFPRFDPVGVEFDAKTKSGKQHTFFWLAPYNGKPARVFKWNCNRQSWKECPQSSLSEKRTAKLIEFWEAQTDIGLWISRSKKLAEVG